MLAAWRLADRRGSSSARGLKELTIERTQTNLPDLPSGATSLTNKVQLRAMSTTRKGKSAEKNPALASAVFALISDISDRDLSLDDMLDHLYANLREVMPYDRMSLAMIDGTGDVAVTRWVQSKRKISLREWFRSRLDATSLVQVAKSGEPRIINDLGAYLESHPESVPTRLIFEEGMKSSLTFPLISREKPIGFLFFNCEKKDSYTTDHAAMLRLVASQLSKIVETSWLYTYVDEQKALIDQQNREFERELEVARKLQLSMIPSIDMKFPYLSVEHAYYPTTNIGGDFFDVVDLEDDRTMVLVADAMGHGPQAAMIVAAVKAMWNNAHRVWSDPALILRDMNIELCDLVDNHMVTAVCAVLDPVNRTLHVSNAGHPPPRAYRAASRSVVKIGESAMALGLEPGGQYETWSFPLDPGDILVLATDGVLEAFRHVSESFGEKRLDRCLSDYASGGARELMSRCMDDVWAFANKGKWDDDLTMVVVEVLAAPQDFGRGKRMAHSENIQWLEIDNRISDLAPLLDEIEARILTERISGDIATEVRLIAEEAISNIINFGYPDQRHERIRVSLDFTRDCLQLEIRDGGIPFNPLEVAPPDFNILPEHRRPGGLGVYLIKTLADQISYTREGAGNILRLKKNISAVCG